LKVKRLFAARKGKAAATASWTALRESFRRQTRKGEGGRLESSAGSDGESRQRNNGQPTTSSFRNLAVATEQSLWRVKLAHREKSFWYPYTTLKNIAALERLSESVGLNLVQLCQGRHGKIADIGAGDGDLGFFLEKMGLSVDIIDNEPTNFNRLEGARILKEALNSAATIRAIDLDSQFSLARERYDAIFFLGTLYHLKNPFFILESLARMTRYCFVSTRIARQTAGGQPLSQYPIAYLLGAQECNNDDTNFWIFSDEGLKRLIDRTGWNILSYLTIGATTNSTPADPDRDERAFCLLQSRTVPALSASPNPIPAGKEAGKTTISWSSGDKGGGKVYVSSDGGEESLFATERQNSCVANWIQTGSSYEFRLYNSDHTKLLDKVVVTKLGKIAPTLRAFPNPVPAGEQAGKTTISWDTGDGSVGQVYISTNGGEESLFATARQDSVPANWIQTGTNYEFRLYNSDHTKLLDKVVVTKLGKIAPTLRAFPNPVPSGEGDGTTTITWNTGGGTVGQVYVSADGKEESIFGHSPQSSSTADWIKTGSTYQFRLYTGTERGKLLAETTVTRNEAST